jgi:hypothetical protein
MLGVLAYKLYADALLPRSLCGENACRMDKRSWSQGFKAGEVLGKTDVEKLSTICLCEMFFCFCFDLAGCFCDPYRGCVQIVSVA